MASTTLYCGRSDIDDRLSVAGVRFVADDNQSDDVTEAQRVSAIDTAIKFAGAMIDSALWPWVETVPITQDTTTRNQYLLDVCVDLACERAAQRSGGTVPQVLADAADDARERLDLIREGELRVPGVDYPLDSHPQDLKRVGLPITVVHHRKHSHTVRRS